MEPEEVTVQPYHWVEEDEVTHDDRLAIYAWGLGRNDENYLLRFENFPVICHIGLPEFIKGRRFLWRKDHAQSVFGYLCRALSYGGNDHAPEGYILKDMEKLYYYQGEQKFPAMLVSFKTRRAMDHCKNLLKQPRDIKGIGQVQLTMHEDDISSTRKLLTAKECGYAQWMRIQGEKVPEDLKISNLENEYLVNWISLNPIPPEETADWVTHPRILAIDGEMYSPNHKALPNKHHAADVCYMLSCIDQRVGKPETRKRYLIIVGECNPIEGTDIITVPSEKDLCHAFIDLVERLQPDILTGYNIFGFDFPYLDARLKRKGLDWPAKGCRLKGRRPKLGGSSWKSSGYGYNDVHLLQMDGRICIDLLPIIKRDYKLPKYTLEVVSQNFIGRGKHDVSPVEMFEIYERFEGATRMYRHCLREVVDGKPVFHGRYDKKVIDEVIRRYDAARAEMTRVSAYCVEDSELVLDIFEKISGWIGLIEMSNIVGVPVLDLFTRGQQVRGISLIYNYASVREILMDTRKRDRLKFAGAYVHEPKPGLYDNVICLDFKSLYPTIMITLNICFTTLIRPEDTHIPDEMCNVVEWDEDDDDDDDEEDGRGGGGGGRRHYRFRFIKKEYKEGILPIILKGLLSARNATKKLMKKATNAIMKTVLDKRQNALKVSANSLYGFLGFQDGKRSLIEGAMCVTAFGRESITRVNKYIEDKYSGTIVYNDTDSTMVTLPWVKTGAEAIEWGKKLEIEISATFNDPMYLEFEKAGRMFSICKKKYVYWLLDKKGNLRDIDDPEADALLYKGIVLARRDNCRWQREVYSKVLRNIILRKGMQDTLDLIVEACMDLLRGKVNWKDLLIIRALGSNYKSDSYFMKIFGDELQRIGKPANPGDRLEYIIVKTDDPEKKLLGYKMRLPEVFEESDEPVDAEYYISKILKNCIEQLWEVGFKEELDRLEEEKKIDDHLKILHELRDKGMANEVDSAYFNYGNNPMAVVEEFLKGPLRNKTIMARRKHVSGKSIFDTRINKTPIKLISKGIEKGHLQEVIQSLASERLYRKLYPLQVKVVAPTAPTAPTVTIVI